MRTHRWLYGRVRGWLPAALAALASGACEDAMSPSDPGNLVPRTVAEDPALPAIQMNGSRFHLETRGDSAKPVIIFLHGGPGGDYRSMLRMAERFGGRSLADDYFLVFWDQRGSGLSARQSRAGLTIETYVADLDALVERYSPGRPVYLIGISWGGMFATKYVDTHPGKVAGAVLIESGPLDGATMERIKRKTIDLDIGAEWLNDAAWSSQFISPEDHARMDYDRMLGLRDSQSRYHQSRVEQEPGWRQGAVANKALMEGGQDGHGRFDYDFTTHLAAYTTPVLFVTGALSEVLGESLQRTQMRRYPSATLQVVAGAGHDVAWVKTAEVLTHVRAYLDARRGGVR